ncbi:DNA internalization-related competence protein ComEC/Rec2 [Pseudoxanthomonas composti]|uniref:DNA internalization-related competence protein ComEC/Rec2 n=1 Tax=Pseudoxanthomonas composti TaxID=2137479 RepID=A0A4Q1JWP4_9GAMM|nr:DNA internalization-related competence protein ComEC/Rec2 [Pseudoxanthomonas composti]
MTRLLPQGRGWHLGPVQPGLRAWVRDWQVGAFAVPVAAALVAGCVGVLQLPVLPPIWLLCGLLPLGLFAWWNGGTARLIGAALTGVACCGLHAALVLGQQLAPADEGREMIVQGVVASLPDQQARRARFLFELDADAALSLPSGRQLVLSWYDDFDAQAPGPRTALRAGQRWRFQAKLRAPRGLRNPGGLDAERQLLAQRIAATGYVRAPEQAVLLAPAAGLGAWRDATARRIQAAVGTSSARFVTALAIGDTRGLQDRDWELLRAAGLTHLIAISGFHVGLVSGLCALLASALWRCCPALGLRLPRPTACALAAVAGASGYAAIAGFALPTVRTVLMIGVVALARGWRRPLGASRALALAAIAVLLVDPLSVLVAGFWLSFAGVAWLVWCMPRSEGARLREFLSAQGVATVGLLPLTAMLFGQASLAGPLANLVAIPWWSLVVVPLSLIGTGLEALHAGWGGGPWRLAAWCFDLSWPLFTWLASGRLSLLWLPEASALAFALALVGGLWLLLPRAVPGKPWALLLWLPLLWPSTQRPPQGAVDVTVLDVGQGLSVLVRTHRHTLLYDAGPAVPEGFDAGERVVLPALHALGVRHLDKLMLSHGDADHAGGLEAVRRGMPTHRVQAPAGSPVPFDQACRTGQAWTWDGVRFQVLHPGAHFPYLRNEASCVLRIEGRHGALLLTGDIGEVIERKLLRQQRALLKADVVLAAHHGSSGSSEPGFVRATGARLALVSAGFGNRFGHPHTGAVRRWQRHGAEVLNTAESGALTVWLDADGLSVRERRQFQRRPWDAVWLRRAARLSYRPAIDRPSTPKD